MDDGEPWPGIWGDPSTDDGTVWGYQHLQVTHSFLSSSSQLFISLWLELHSQSSVTDFSSLLEHNAIKTGFAKSWDFSTFYLPRIPCDDVMYE